MPIWHPASAPHARHHTAALCAGHTTWPALAGHTSHGSLLHGAQTRSPDHPTLHPPPDTLHPICTLNPVPDTRSPTPDAKGEVHTRLTAHQLTEHHRDASFESWARSISKVAWSVGREGFPTVVSSRATEINCHIAGAKASWRGKRGFRQRGNLGTMVTALQDEGRHDESPPERPQVGTWTRRSRRNCARCSGTRKNDGHWLHLTRPRRQ